MNICKRCGKENQEHYKFCLGCGGELTSSQSPAVGPQKTVMAQVGVGIPLGGPPPAGPGAATAPTPPGGVPAISGGPSPTGTPGLGVPVGLGGGGMSSPSAATLAGPGAAPAPLGPPPLSGPAVSPFGGNPSPYGAPNPLSGPSGGGPAKTMMAPVGGASPGPLPPVGAVPPPPGWSGPPITPGYPAGGGGFPPPGPPSSGYSAQPLPGVTPYQPSPGPAPFGGSNQASPFGGGNQSPFGGPSPAPQSFGAPMPGFPPGPSPGVGGAGPGFPPPAGYGSPSAPVSGGYLAQSAPVPSVAPPGPSSGQLPTVSRTCPNCGAEIPGSFQFCGACGARLGAAAPGAARTGTTGELSARVAPVAEPKPHGRLTLIRPDGTEGGQHELEEGENRIGRQHGALFENDGYLSPSHAEVIVNAAGAVIRDLGSLNGVFCKMAGEEELQSGDVFRIGQELLRYDTISPPQPLEDGTEIMGSPNPGYWGRLSVIIGKEIDGSAFPLFGDAVTIGRERGDVNFPDDGYVSGVHARITQRDGKTFIVDLGSSNGTFVKLRGERVVQDGAFVLFGQQLFRVNMNVG